METFPLRLSMFAKDMIWEKYVIFGNFNRENPHLTSSYVCIHHGLLLNYQQKLKILKSYASQKNMHGKLGIGSKGRE